MKAEGNELGLGSYTQVLYRQSKYEAFIVIAIYCLYFIWWWGCSYMLEEAFFFKSLYILGFPAWFFLSCLVGYPLLCIGLWAVVCFYFKNLSLDVLPEEESTV